MPLRLERGAEQPRLARQRRQALVIDRVRARLAEHRDQRGKVGCHGRLQAAEPREVEIGLPEGQRRPGRRIELEEAFVLRPDLVLGALDRLGDHQAAGDHGAAEAQLALLDHLGPLVLHPHDAAQQQADVAPGHLDRAAVPRQRGERVRAELEAAHHEPLLLGLHRLGAQYQNVEAPRAQLVGELFRRPALGERSEDRRPSRRLAHPAARFEERAAEHRREAHCEGVSGVFVELQGDDVHGGGENCTAA